jgi:hypothetical protein
MIRSGFTDTALDDEARQLVAAAEAQRSIDAGVESVLLVSAQAEVEALQGRCKLLEQELSSSRQRYADVCLGWVLVRVLCCWCQNRQKWKPCRASASFWNRSSAAAGRGETR